MARRYVPKTYNNRRFLRIITGAIITLVLSVIIIFLVLFFYLQAFVVDGQLQIPLLSEETSTPPTPPTVTQEPADPTDLTE